MICLLMKLDEDLKDFSIKSERTASLDTTSDILGQNADIFVHDYATCFMFYLKRIDIFAETIYLCSYEGTSCM